MNTYSYVRISSVCQNESRQLIAMQEQNVPPENIFIDKLSGKNTKRPELQRLMQTVKTGDTVIVESISRFARNTRDLLSLVDRLTEKGVDFVSLKERIDTTTPTGKFTLTIFGAVAELERDYILQRQAEGIAAAKARGVRFGRPPKKAPDNFGELVNQWERGYIDIAEILTRCDMKETTFYKRLGEHRIIQQHKLKRTS